MKNEFQSEEQWNSKTKLRAEITKFVKILLDNEDNPKTILTISDNVFFNHYFPDFWWYLSFFKLYATSLLQNKCIYSLAPIHFVDAMYILFLHALERLL